MEMKMATLEKAEELIEKLCSASWNAAIQDMQDLKDFAKSQDAAEAEELTHWDINFWSERLRESRYNISKVWNKDLRSYCVKNCLGIPIAYFYFDPYSHPSEKQGGAWMGVVVGWSRTVSLDGTSPRLPVAHIACNQTPPVGDKPSRMTIREVEAVFHEFGHALQHMLTKQDESLVSGYQGIEWDAVELPSQLWKIGVTKGYASVDLELHSKYIPGGPESIYDIDQRVGKMTHVIPLLLEDRFLCSFSHIFADQYAAGYYSYQWAEVLAYDAFSVFEEVGLDNEQAVKELGHKFQDCTCSWRGKIASGGLCRVPRA